MKCPACSKDLVQTTVSDVELDLCKNGCGGIWFDRGEIQKFDDTTEFVPPEIIPTNRPSSDTLNPFPRACPKCPGDNLMRQNYDWKNPVEIDMCWKCGGVWVDINELTAIREGGGDREAAGDAFVRASVNLMDMAKEKRGEYAEHSKLQSMVDSLKKAFFRG
mgnify:CR=1 FL=1